ncbi:MAG: hypothetical protein JNM94_06580 [Phycisphaerae bacterium]|nr:hypothetical protein [Phycisphaerae bacterium]
MRTTLTSILAIAAVGTLLAAAPQGAPAQAPAPGTDRAGNVVGVAPVPPTPASIGELVLVRPFTLTTGYVHEWRKERPTVDAGVIVVIRANPELIRARQVAQPVLVVGSQTAEHMNDGYASGTLVAIVPATRKADGSVDLDLEAQPIWFAAPELPEAVDAAWIATQRTIADRSSIAPAAKGVVQAAATRGGTTLTLADRDALDKVVGALVRTYAPDETERADALEGKNVEAVAPKAK